MPYQRGQLRSDVIYKAIIRDMRKFFSKEFNQVTLFKAKKKNKPRQLFFGSLNLYLNTNFTEFKSAIIERDSN